MSILSENPKYQFTDSELEALGDQWLEKTLGRMSQNQKRRMLVLLKGELTAPRGHPKKFTDAQLFTLLVEIAAFWQAGGGREKALQEAARINGTTVNQIEKVWLTQARAVANAPAYRNFFPKTYRWIRRPKGKPTTV